MIYKFNPTQHSTKIKAGLLKAKQAGKKLGRPRGGKIKGEDEVIRFYTNQLTRLKYQLLAALAGISKSTVQKIINKYRKEKHDF